MPGGGTAVAAPATLNDLGRGLIAQLEEIVNGGDDKIPAPEHSFVTWCTPGIPFDPAEFDFCEKGLGGGATAEEEKALLQHAFNFAQLVDLVPDASCVFDSEKQSAVYRTSEARLSHIYGEILRVAKVVKGDLTPKQEAKLKQLRKVLRQTITVINPVSDEKEQKVVDGPWLVDYNKYMAAYVAAALMYNNKRIAAQTATGPDGRAAVMDFSTNGELYRMQAQQALDNWIADGHRNEIQQIYAYIDQTTARSMTLWLKALKEHYNGGLLSALGAGQQFYLTTLIPGDFATSGGWTGFSMNHESTHVASHEKTSGLTASAGLTFPLLGVPLGIGGGGSYEKSEKSGDTELSSFKLSFELAQVAISRAWFYPEFFMNRGWTLQKGHGWNYELPSDGAMPPHGSVIGYPTTIIFARNIVIESADFVSAYKQTASSLGVNAKIGWGPFSLSGSYHQAESSSEFSSDTTAKSLKVPGMQIIGFVNHLLDKCPNPLPELKDSDFE